jgi:hypothetical protein
VLIKAVDLERLDPVRDHVCSKLSDDPGGGDDSGKPGEPEAPGSEQEHPDCACLMACAERCCAERSWVLLACITISHADDQGCESGYTLGEVDSDGRKYVKPIECCRSSHQAEPAPEVPVTQSPDVPPTPTATPTVPVP